MSQALYRKWRPQKWDEVIGQPHIVQTLKNAVAGERVAHAYLFKHLILLEFGSGLEFVNWMGSSSLMRLLQPYDRSP